MYLGGSDHELHPCRANREIYTSKTPYLAIDERAPGKEASFLFVSVHYAVKYCIYMLWTMCLFCQY